MITPADIQNKEFTKGFRGYDIEEVDMFLDLITLDLEKLIKENLNLKAQVATLEKDQGSIAGSDLTVKETLETAKKIMDDLAVSSEKRAKTIVENAEMDAAIIIKDAKMKAEEVAAESAALTNSFENFKREYKDMLERYQNDFDYIAKNIDIDSLAALIKEKESSKDTSNVASKVEDFISESISEEVNEPTMVKSSVEETVLRDAEESTEDAKKTMINIKYEYSLRRRGRDAP